jgi:hypothetical protein
MNEAPPKNPLLRRTAENPLPTHSPQLAAHDPIRENRPRMPANLPNAATPAAPPKRRDPLPWALFIAVFLIHVGSCVCTPGDSRWTVPIAVSLYTEGNLDLDEYPDLLEKHDYYFLEKVNGHYYSKFPIGTPLLATPFIAAMDVSSRALFRLAPGLEERIRRASPEPIDEVDVLSLYWRVETVPASIFVALTAVLIYWMARRALDRPCALLTALLFAFATSAWSVASRSLWQHGPSMLVLSGALLLLQRADEKRWPLPLAGMLLAYGYVIRPTNAIPLALLALYVLVRHRRRAWGYFAGAGLVLAALALFYYTTYGSPLPPYYGAGRLGRQATFFEALAGNWISPSRGLLVYTPLFLFSFVGLGIRLRERTFTLFDAALCATVVLHALAISAFWHWWGGHSYGPRYFSDLIPIFMYFLIPAIGQLEQGARSFAAGWSVRRAAYAGAFLLCAGASLFVHLRGATDMRTWDWNWDPVPVDDARERLWDWRDPAFLRGIGKDLRARVRPGFRDPTRVIPKSGAG